MACTTTLTPSDMTGYEINYQHQPYGQSIQLTQQALNDSALIQQAGAGQALQALQGQTFTGALWDEAEVTPVIGATFMEANDLMYRWEDGTETVIKKPEPIVSFSKWLEKKYNS